jgi:SAM-dependent methyltransferase
MSWLVDPRAVAAEYASERGLNERVLAHRELLDGPDNEDVVRGWILSLRPGRVLDVGSGLGELSTWAKTRVKGDVVAVDSSPRMVELAAQAGVIAVRADMRRLPFADASFDCAVANFVLYHVEDPTTAIAELARVLRPSGALITSTISDDTETRRLAWARLFDEPTPPAQPPLSFSRENGRQLLSRYFNQVDQRDCDAALVFPTRDRLVRYVDAIPPMRGSATRIPELNEPFALPDKTTVFLATGPDLVRRMRPGL